MVSKACSQQVSLTPVRSHWWMLCCSHFFLKGGGGKIQRAHLVPKVAKNCIARVGRSIALELHNSFCQWMISWLDEVYVKQKHWKEIRTPSTGVSTWQSLLPVKLEPPPHLHFLQVPSSHLSSFSSCSLFPSPSSSFLDKEPTSPSSLTHQTPHCPLRSLPRQQAHTRFRCCLHLKCFSFLPLLTKSAWKWVSLSCPSRSTKVFSRVADNGKDSSHLTKPYQSGLVASLKFQAQEESPCI